MSALDRVPRFKRRMFKLGCPVYCCYCMQKVSKQDSSVEHCMPKWLGGGDNHENLLIACKPCNSRKGGDDAIHWEGHRSYECRLRCKDGECLRHEGSKLKLHDYAYQKFGIKIDTTLTIKQMGVILKQHAELMKANAK